MSLTEAMIRDLFKAEMDIDLGEFPEDALRRGGGAFRSDKPDPIPLELIDIKDLMASVDFKVFSGPEC